MLLVLIAQGRSKQLNVLGCMLLLSSTVNVKNLLEHSFVCQGAQLVTETVQVSLKQS